MWPSPFACISGIEPPEREIGRGNYVGNITFMNLNIILISMHYNTISIPPPAPIPILIQ
jgi:hypothetical protein